MLIVIPFLAWFVKNTFILSISIGYGCLLTNAMILSKTFRLVFYLDFELPALDSMENYWDSCKNWLISGALEFRL